MTKLLEEAFQKASHLSDIEQNALARWLLEELESEKKWDKVFSDSEDVLNNLAKEAKEDYDKGKTIKLNLNKL